MDNDFLLSMVESRETAIIVINKDKDIKYINNMTTKLLGDNVKEFIGVTISCKITHNSFTNCQISNKCSICKINKSIERVFLTGESETLDNIYLKRDSVERSLSMKLFVYKENVVIEICDVTMKNDEMKFLLTLAEKTTDIMFYKDSQLRYVYLNKTYANFFNKEKSYIIGKTDEDLLNENLLFRELYEQCSVGDKTTLEKGAYYAIETIGDRQFRVSKEKIDGGIMGVARDITDEINAQKRSEVDELTGLYNRHKLTEVVEEIYSEDKNTYCMALIDLDNLRTLNNEYGHLKGDNYIKALGEVFECNKYCKTFRVGGDEFLALIDSEKVSPQNMFEKVFEKIDTLNLEPKLSISVGVSKFDIRKSYNENFDKVDKILYKVKKNGKNNFAINI